METGRSLRSGKRETGAEMSPDRLFLFHMGDEEKRTRIPRIIDSKILSKGDYDQVPEGQIETFNMVKDMMSERE
jgi:hypothetical protein